MPALPAHANGEGVVPVLMTLPAANNGTPTCCLRLCLAAAALIDSSYRKGQPARTRLGIQGLIPGARWGQEATAVYYGMGGAQFYPLGWLAGWRVGLVATYTWDLQGWAEGGS